MSTIGKQVGQRQYIAVHQLEAASAEVRQATARAESLLRLVTNDAFDLIRVDLTREQVVFLSYPGLGHEPFPPLKYSWRVELQTHRVAQRRFEDSSNPPILHRTELLLPTDHPQLERCKDLTRDCEQLGLFADPTRIGFYQQWQALLAAHGYAVDGFGLVPIGNAEGSTDVFSGDSPNSVVERHLTALVRSALSAPVQRLIKDGLLTSNSTFFDYGCGRGDDLATLSAAGFAATGWDPHYKADGVRAPADVVNLGFVINVIEDRDERVEALLGAFGLTQKVLAVAAMLGSNEETKGQRFRDGVLTSRKTFQKYYSQHELRQFIESALDEEAYPAAPGVYYVFKDSALEQRFLLGRTRSRFIPSPTPSISHVRNAPATPASRPKAPAKPKAADTVEGRRALRSLWELALELGREPDVSEVTVLPELESLFGSFRKAWRSCEALNDPSLLAAAAAQRRDDILVMLALRTFDRRRKFERLEPRLARDLKAFFGSMGRADEEAVRLLFSLNDPQTIGSACEKAATHGLGWLEPGESLQLHSSLLPRLPAALRVYIGCAAVMAGDLTGFDLVKAHINSGKVSLMAYDDFLGKPLPALQQRIKVRLRDQAFDLFQYGDEHPPPVLFLKSRYINEEFPYFAEQVAFEELLEDLKVFDLDSYGPPEAQAKKALRARRYALDGYTLSRCTDIPGLDEPCGTHFTFRDFAECGETWRAAQIPNVPQAPDSYNALCDLCVLVVDPVIEYFGAIELTYGFASTALTKCISHGIAPELDQHAAHERSKRGKYVCERGGAAVDFLVRDEDMVEVARWIASNCAYDRIYVYGSDRPIHVSVGPQNSRSIVRVEERDGRRVPRVVDINAI